MSKLRSHADRMQRARLSLAGLSVGDAFGERFFVSPSVVEGLIAERALPAAPWNCTDDTVMALSVVEVLDVHRGIEQDELAKQFGARYLADHRRGYGGTAHDILRSIGEGEPWQSVAPRVFEGMGSMGNGSAMRVAPVGAYFEDEAAQAAEHAAASAAVTHAHIEGRAGAIAVAVATAVIRRASGPADLFDAALADLPACETQRGIAKASLLPLDYDVRTAAAALGNGSRVLCQDTVPFALWCAAKCMDDFAEALWTTVAGLGDRDTTCAIVGGMVAIRDQASPIPELWLRSREALESLPRA